jgi:hypothetical protein
MAGYSGTPLVKKLGIKPGDTVVVLQGPDGFALDVPDGAVLRNRLSGHADMALLFTTDRATLERRIDALGRAVAPDGIIWIGWPKKASKVPTDMTEQVVRDVALPLGLVDTKVAAIDDIWSGLKLVWRLTARQDARTVKARRSPGS